MSKVTIQSPCDYDMALNSKLVRSYELVNAFFAVQKDEGLTEKQRLVCSNSLKCELIALRVDIGKMCNGEDHQHEKQGPAKRK